MAFPPPERSPWKEETLCWRKQPHRLWLTGNLSLPRISALHLSLPELMLPHPGPFLARVCVCVMGGREGRTYFLLHFTFSGKVWLVLPHSSCAAPALKHPGAFKVAATTFKANPSPNCPYKGAEYTLGFLLC